MGVPASLQPSLQILSGLREPSTGLGDEGDRDLLWWRMCKTASREVRTTWLAGSGMLTCKLITGKDQYCPCLRHLAPGKP